ncbi:hypothetical protein AALO_G00155070 [Alosa alosa]|uniref:Uncharacterized protein n=1 Tax=Alosa alosa TaxID=278164 RepID=A0AAV6GIA8_9TELE|nr:hypothetical protein AALO_G00155070 [Alosa alosa]
MLRECDPLILVNNLYTHTQSIALVWSFSNCWCQYADFMPHLISRGQTGGGVSAAAAGFIRVEMLLITLFSWTPPLKNAQVVDGGGINPAAKGRSSKPGNPWSLAEEDASTSNPLSLAEEDAGARGTQAALYHPALTLTTNQREQRRNRRSNTTTKDTGEHTTCF